MRASLSFLVVALCLLPPPAAASPIYWLLRGDVGPAPPDSVLAPVFPDSTPVEFLITIDPAVPDLCAEPDAGLYIEPPALVTVGGQTYASEFTAFEVNNPEGNCPSSFPPTGVVVRMFFNGLNGTTAPFGGALLLLGGAPGDGLPLAPPPGAFVGFSYVGQDYDTWGEISSAEVVTSNAVPEPPSLQSSAIGIAIVFSLCARRRRVGIAESPRQNRVIDLKSRV